VEIVNDLLVDCKYGKQQFPVDICFWVKRVKYRIPSKQVGIETFTKLNMSSVISGVNNELAIKLVLEPIKVIVPPNIEEKLKLNKIVFEFHLR
jgi:hypothetical protein